MQLLDIYDVQTLTEIIEKLENSQNPYEYKDGIVQIF